MHAFEDKEEDSKKRRYSKSTSDSLKKEGILSQTSESRARKKDRQGHCKANLTKS